MDFIADWGLIAGIAGLALGVFLILFREVIRKKIFPVLTKKQSFQIIIVFMLLVWSIAGYSIYGYFAMNETVKKVNINPNLNKSFLLGHESAYALAKTNTNEKNDREIFKINQWLKDLKVDYNVNSERFTENDFLSIVNHISPKSESFQYSFLLGFYSIVCENTPAQCHEEFNLKVWLKRSDLKSTGYKGNDTEIENFIKEMSEFCYSRLD